MTDKQKKLFAKIKPWIPQSRIKKLENELKSATNRKAFDLLKPFTTTNNGDFDRGIYEAYF